MKVYCYDDMISWGKMLFDLARKQGIEAHMFVRADQVEPGPDTFAFMHLMHHPFERQYYDKSVASAISKKQLVMIPTIQECIMYDDKWMCYEKYPKWTPKTHLISSYRQACEICKSVSFPLISKAKQGAASSNVRLVQNEQQARKEIEEAFVAGGIAQFGGAKQKGYLIWQEFCANNTHDWRVIMLAKKYGYVLKRHNRPDVPFASGSGRLGPIWELDKETEALLNFTREFAVEGNLSFVGVDIVYNSENKPVILEITTGWDINGYKGCQIFEYNDGAFRPTRMDGKDDLFSALILGMKRKEF